MLVRFSSVKTESITMFGDNAIQLIRMLGASGTVPGAVSAEDLPAAMNSLRERLKTATTASMGASFDGAQTEEDEEGKEREPPVDLATRALPLLDLLQRAASAHVPVMWEKA